ncbi:MAG TPA: amino acid permease, partial [Verrucomicrobiae bacterium]|nr:amino acid permease [Verrucomicrobiae bacterium]
MKSEQSPVRASEKQAAPHSINAGLLPALGLFTTIMMVVGGVIGSGIFRKPGLMAGQVGSPAILFGVWFIAGVLTLFGALTNAEIASVIPETGGQYVYFEKMFGPFFAYLYGWAVFAVIQTGSIAAVAYVFAEYAGELVRLPQLGPALSSFTIHFPFIGDVAPLADIGVKSLAAALVIGLTVVNYIGVKLGGIVQNIFTIAKVAAMAALFIGAFFLPTGGAMANLTTPSAVIHPAGFALLLAIV